MRKKLTKISVLAIVATTLCLFSDAYARHPGGEGEGPEGGREKRGEYMQKKMDEIYDRLDLTPEQEEKIRAQRREEREKSRELMEKYRAKRGELRTELEKETIDKARVDLLIKEVTTVKQEILRQRVDRIMATREILTSEQFRKLQEMKKEKMEKMRSKMKERHKKDKR